jgi:hypothetical protein
MTLSSKQIDDIGNLYENIIASGQEEQLNEDLIGDIISNRGKIRSAVTRAASASGNAASATNRAIGGAVSNTARQVQRGASSTARDVAKGYQYGGALGALGALGGRISQGIMSQGSKPVEKPKPTPAPPKPTPAPPKPTPAPPKPTPDPAAAKPAPSAPKPLGFTPRTLTSAELKAATAARAAARSAGKSTADVEKDAIAAVSKLQKSSFDIFDVIKGHLLDEGYADTEQAALAIMANMSEEWRQSIVEGGFNSSGRYDVGGGRTVGPVAGAVRSLFSGNLPKGQTYVPPTKQTGPNRPPAVPASKDDSGKLTDFGAGGGKKKMQSSGMSVGQVERQGRMNKGDYSS